MGSQGSLVRGQTPDTEVVYLLDALHPQEGGLDHIVTDARGRGLHQDLEGVPQDADGGGQHKDAEDEGADWINDRIFWFKIYNKSCCEYSWK